MGFRASVIRKFRAFMGISGFRGEDFGLLWREFRDFLGRISGFCGEDFGLLWGFPGEDFGFSQGRFRAFMGISCFCGEDSWERFRVLMGILGSFRALARKIFGC